MHKVDGKSIPLVFWRFRIWSGGLVKLFTGGIDGGKSFDMSAGTGIPEVCAPPHVNLVQMKICARFAPPYEEVFRKGKSEND